MKFKTILTNIFAALILVVSISSCGKDFLDEKMYSNYGPETTDVKAKVLAIHNEFRYLMSYSSNQGFISCWQVGTDAVSPANIEYAEVPFYRYHELTAESAGARIIWERYFSMINKANLVISVDNNPATDAEIAEAKFFRAYAYNNLANLFGDLPLITESASEPRTDYSRNPVSEINALVVEDIEYAIANCLALGETADESRINSDMARQLAAEIYLRLGMDDASYFKKAEDVITPIIENGNYSLVKQRYGLYTNEDGDYYSDIFKKGNLRRSEGNSEAIWVVENEKSSEVIGGVYDNPQQRRNWVTAYYNLVGMDLCDSLGGRGLGRMRLSNYVKYQLYADNDIRNSCYNLRRKFYINKIDFEQEIGLDANGYRVDLGSSDQVSTTTLRTGDMTIPRAGDTISNTSPYITKWGEFDPSNTFGYAMIKDFPIMRYSETYLLRAEARFRQGDLNGAAEDINVIRDRAFQYARATDVNAGVVSESDITMDFILDERIRELIGEEQRRMTLVRTRTLSERYKLGDCGDTSEELVTTGFQEHNNLLPIPYTEIILNKDGDFPQNPGY